MNCHVCQGHGDLIWLEDPNAPFASTGANAEHVEHHLHHS